jgi:N-acetylmuramoyl-L-alanine amidase
MGTGTARRVARGLALMSIIALSTAPAAAQVPQNDPALRDAIVAADKTRTRFVIGLDREVAYTVSSHASRVVIDLPDVKFQLPPAPAGTVGLVRSFSGGLAAPGKVRVIIDTIAPVMVEKSALEKGRTPRIVLDMMLADADRSGARKSPVGAMGAGLGAVPPPVAKAAQRPRAREDASYKPLIVIDPGHGGQDTGAQRYGTVEKDVVLAFSLKLRDKLLASGRYRVMMTRDTDVFVDLDERRDFGDRHKAALFIAVHADYAGSSARGATIYSLRDTTSASLQHAAKREATELTDAEQQTIRRGGDTAGIVAGILGDLAGREVEVNKERTNLFSRAAVEFMGSSTPINNNPEREANFRVLKSAKTPSVLIELAYVTNAEDARNLRSDSWRERVSGALMTAIENYFSHKEARLPL